jgi:hypothetical protein
MGLKSCFLVMNARPGAQSSRPLAEAVSCLFDEWLTVFFAPRVLHVSADGGKEVTFSCLGRPVPRGSQTFWKGESVDARQSLTRCDPADSVPMLAEVKRWLAERQPRELYLSTEGALYHRAAKDALPQWYGRWFISSTPELIELVVIRIEWNRERRGVEVSFQNSGYPLTSAALLKSPRLGRGNRIVAAANRDSILPALAYVRKSFGLDQEDAVWTSEGEYAALYPDDATAIRKGWLPKLNGASPVHAPEGEPIALTREATDEDVHFYLDTLAHGGRDDRAIALRNLARSPTGDSRVQPVLEKLLNDVTPCLLQIPYRFGELRLLAAQALVAERRAAGDDRPVRLRTIAPLTADELEQTREAAGTRAPSRSDNPIENQLDLYSVLRERGVLKEVDVELGTG